MKPALLILSTAALALAGPIIPTMVPDREIPAISTSTDEPRPTPTEGFFQGPWPRFLCARGDPPHDLYPCDNWWEQVNFDEEFELEPAETEIAGVK